MSAQFSFALTSAKCLAKVTRKVLPLGEPTLRTRMTTTAAIFLSHVGIPARSTAFSRFPNRFLSRFFPILVGLLLLFCPGLSSQVFAEESSSKNILLSRGELEVHIYQPKQPPLALMVFGSGDGGWTAWEDQVCTWMMEQGWLVAGVDFRTYATHDYDENVLGYDFAEIVEHVTPTGAQLPVFYGGWSMGAPQAVSAAAHEGHPAHLKGVLLISSGARGRYGLRTKDELGIAPTGDGTFGLTDFRDEMADLRVAQMQGGADFISSSAWIYSLTSTKALYDLPGFNHGFDGPSDEFKPHLLQAMAWLMGDDSKAPIAASHTLPFGLSPLWPAAVLSILLTLVFIFSRKHAVRILVAAVAVLGLINLIEALFPKPPEVIDWMQQWMPLSASENSRLLLLISGTALLGLARGLRRHKRVAWWLATGLLIASVILHGVRAFDWHHSLAAALLLIPLFRWRRDFFAMSDAPSVRLGIFTALIAFFVLSLYGVISLRTFSQHGLLGDEISWMDIFKNSVMSVLGRPSDLVGSENPAVAQLLSQLRYAGIGAATLALVFLLRPVVARRSVIASEEDQNRARDLVVRYGRDPSDPFTLLEDKRYLFDPSGEGFIAYSSWRNIAVALADPVGPENKRGEMIAEFVRFCRKQDWVPLFYATGSDTRALYEEAGLVTFKVGEDARLPLADFHTQGGKFQNLRTARNKARKEGLSYLWYDANTAPNPEIETQLKEISDAWLASKQGGEMTFDLGAFSIDSLRADGAAIALHPDGKVECFATWLPYAGGTGRTLDLMRGKNTVSGIMDFLILESIDHFKGLGVTEVSLGNAPLANTVEDPAQMSREERRVKLLYDRFNRFYGYKSLFDFKRKYHPAWKGRYLAYPPGTLLAEIGLAVAAVHLPGGFRGLWRS